MHLHLRLRLFASNSDESCSFLISLNFLLNAFVCSAVSRIDETVDDAVEKQIKSHQLLFVYIHICILLLPLSLSLFRFVASFFFRCSFEINSLTRHFTTFVSHNTVLLLHRQSRGQVILGKYAFFHTNLSLHMHTTAACLLLNQQILATVFASVHNMACVSFYLLCACVYLDKCRNDRGLITLCVCVCLGGKKSCSSELKSNMWHIEFLWKNTLGHTPIVSVV